MIRDNNKQKNEKKESNLNDLERLRCGGEPLDQTDAEPGQTEAHHARRPALERQRRQTDRPLWNEQHSQKKWKTFF